MDARRYRESVQLAGQVERLIGQLVPELDGSDDDARAGRLLQFSLRVLSSRIASTSLAPATQSAELARRRLVQAGRASDALAFSELLQRLERSAHGLAQLPGLLQLFTALMHSQPQSSLAVCAGALLLSRPLATAAPPVQIDPAAVEAPEPQAVERGHAAAASSGGEHASGVDRVLDGSSSELRRPPGWGGSTDGLTEEVLVRELLFVMQNIDGVYLKWDASVDAFTFAKPVALPAGARQLVGRLCELGWLYRQVHGYIHAAKDGGANAGLVPQSFRHSLQVDQPASSADPHPCVRTHNPVSPLSPSPAAFARPLPHPPPRPQRTRRRAPGRTRPS